jgi:outer membrane protein assembly factor BamB
MEFKSRVFRGHSGPVYALAHDSEFVYSTSSDRFVTRWNLETGEQDRFAVQLDSPAYCIFVKDSILFVGCNNGTVRAIDLITKKLLWELNRFGKAVFALCWSHTLNLLLIGDQEGNLYAIDETGKFSWYFPLDSGKIRVIREFGTAFLVGSQDGKLRSFQTPSLNENWSSQVHEGSVYCVLKTENGYVSGGLDGHVTQLKENGTIIKKIPVHYQSVYAVELFEEGFVTCSKDKTIKVWTKDWRIRQKIDGIGAHLKSVNALFPMEDGFVTASDDKTIRFWNKI